MEHGSLVRPGEDATASIALLRLAADIPLWPEAGIHEPLYRREQRSNRGTHVLKVQMGEIIAGLVVVVMQAIA